MHIELEIKRLIETDLEQCELLYNEMKGLQKVLPKGSLVKRGKSYNHVYWQDGEQKRDLIEDMELAGQIKLQQFIKKVLPEIEQRIKLSKMFLLKSRIYDPLKVFAEMPESYRGIDTYDVFLQDDVDPEKWKTADYARNTHSYEAIHYTKGKVQVRSKAEAMIGTQIEQRGWTYRTEPRMMFGSKIKCPDFEIVHPYTRRIIYLEHFGKMNDPGYIKDTMEKMILYRKYGLYLGVNFFFTWETLDRPLTIDRIEDVLDEIEAAGIEFKKPIYC